MKKFIHSLINVTDAKFTELFFSLSIPLTLLVVLNHEYSPFFFALFHHNRILTIYDYSSMCSQIDPKIALGQMQANMWPRPLDGFGIVPLSRKKEKWYPLISERKAMKIYRGSEKYVLTQLLIFFPYSFIFLLLIHSFNLICELCV